MCNGIESQPSLLWLLNGTDETDCEDSWCFILSSTRCDGYWDCIDGRDELNCSTKLSYSTKTSIALHNLSGCNMDEHFCLPITDLPGNISRSCLSISRVSDGHIDCWGATDERRSFCDYTIHGSDILKRYHCAGDNKICISLITVCNGHADCPLKDDETLCDWLPLSVDENYFYCRNGIRILRRVKLCNGELDCADGEDEWFCNLKIPRSSKTTIRAFHEIYFPVYPIDLPEIFASDTFSIQRIPPTSLFIASNWYCNRGMAIKNRGQRRCLCPSSYMDERCEIQRARVSLFLQVISPASLQREIAIKLIVYLIDITSMDTLGDEEILHLPYIHSLYKHLVTLPSIHANTSFVRIDAYEVNMQQIIAYRTSWKFDLPFPFLPVRRLAARLILSDDQNFAFRRRASCRSCIHGECLSYQNSDDVFCRCHNGWVGATCNVSFMCAFGAVTLNSYRCLCPMSRYGNRCFIPNIVKCSCQNGGACIPLDARIEQSVCLCSDNFFGKHCERVHANVTIKLNGMQQIKSLPVLLVQFVAVFEHSDTHFENVFLFERVSTHHVLVVHHVGYEKLPLMVLCKIFYSSSIHDYAYYLVSYLPRDRLDNKYLAHIHAQLEFKQKCSHVHEMEIFKSPINILAYPHVKCSKFYIRACKDNITRCFHDEVYLCFCPDDDTRIPSCITYDHTRETCKEPSYCLNGGLCIENRRKGIIEFSCLCTDCHYYGSLCQFSIGQQGLSLNALVGVEMRTGMPLSEQAILIKVSMIIIVCMITIGSVRNTLSTMVFFRKKTREAGCGWYLLLMSISNQCALIVFGLRFVYLLLTQMIVWSNQTQSFILCQCLEFGLAFLWNLSNWLSVCVSVERTSTVARGALFNKKGSVRIAKGLCMILPLVFTAMAIHEPMTRNLIKDPRLGQYTWCVTKFNSPTMKRVAIFFSIFHLLGPFLINLAATGILVFIISRQKFTVRKGAVQKTFIVVLREQIAYYKHLIISPVVLLILTFPRLVISLASICIDTSWRNYVFLAGYFISFIPFMTTLLIFVLPAPVYQDELKLCLLRFRHFSVCK